MISDKAYKEKFYEPNFTAYDFVSLFSAVNAMRGKLSFDRDSLIKCIDISKQNNEYVRLLSDINFKNNGVDNFSEEFDDAVFQLKMVNILYTISPEKNSKIFISEDIPFADIILNKKEYFEEMNSFVEMYYNFDKNGQEKNTGTTKKIRMNQNLVIKI